MDGWMIVFVLLIKGSLRIVAVGFSMFHCDQWLLLQRITYFGPFRHFFIHGLF